MSKYKLNYFNARGWAEPTRWLFALTETSYEDIRFEILDWQAVDKTKFPWGQLPVLEVDGKILAQSMSIARFVARRHSLVGKNEFEEAKCDEIVDCVKDFAEHWKSVSMYSKESEESKRLKIIEIMETVTPKYFDGFESILETNGGEWLVGDAMTWADIVVVYIITQFNVLFKIELEKERTGLAKLVERVTNVPRIKDWINKRPVTVA